ncbi:MAG: RDD family protein [Clostridia bacterium]|nr:RDD family protein [Clostridia bacterium]
MLDLQKASLGKRISAFLLDVILFVILATGAALLISAIVGFDGYLAEFEALEIEYSENYGIKLDLSEEEKAKLTQEDLAKMEAANEAFSKDERAISLYGMLISLILVMLSIAPLVSAFVLEFLVPLFLSNGQTVGKKIFGIGVMMTNSVKITGLALFARSILGKYVVETAVPLVMFLLMLFGGDGFVSALVILGILAVNVIFLFKGRRMIIHDYLSYTVCVDMSSQMIFDTPEAAEEYKKRMIEQRLDTTQ